MVVKPFNFIAEEDAFMSKARRFLANESLQCLNTKCELSTCQGTLCTDISRTQPFTDKPLVYVYASKQFQAAK
jgi:hypothetical protein